MHSSLAVVLPILLSFLSSSAEASANCNETSLCPKESPCCSEYGFCGTNTYCLGGCNPWASNSLSSCKPNPICQDGNHTFANFDRIAMDANAYDGDASAHDWVLNSGNLVTTPEGDLGLILTEANQGTRLSSTRYVHYGKMTARIKTGRWGGVVTAFITMSDVKDEIDWEFPGNAVTEGQTNYFWQGHIPIGSNNGHVETGLTDTYANYHDYTIDWQPKTLTFSIDGKVVRTVNAADNKDDSGVIQFPSTPARVQLSIWPAGIPSSAPGTVQWGGGMINWKDPDYTSSGGHFFALVRSVTIECGDAEARQAGVTAYTYGPKSESPSIKVGDVLLKSRANSMAGRGFYFHATMATVVGLMITASML